MEKISYSLGEPLLRIENVSLAFGKVEFAEDGSISSAEKLVLYDINGEIRNIIRPGMNQGQVVGLLGPSGIGKTQLFKIIAGLQKPTTGRVLLSADGIPTNPGMVGVVPQDYPLLEHRKVLKNLVRAGRLAGLSRKDATEKAKQYLDRFGLGDKADCWPCQLSGGQRQRISICQQMMCSEHFILMDEPFSGLDVLLLEKVVHLINEVSIADELNTIIVVTHDVSAAVTVSDTLWLLGRDREPNGEIIPGAYIKEKINLIEQGLAWHPEISQTQEFLTFVRDIKKRFKEL